jgi:hypothetical protein
MGLSAKQRYYNNLAKKGKITKAQAASYGVSEKDKKKSSSKSSSSSISNPYAKYQSMDWGSAAEAAKRAGIDISTGSDFDLAMNQKYNPSNYESLIKKNANIGPWAAGYGSETEYGKGGTKAGNTYSQREQAAKAVGKVAGASTTGDIIRKGLGIGTANASGSHLVTPKVDKTTGILGSLFMKGIEPLRGVYANLTGGRALPELGLSESLGLTEKVDGGLTYNLSDTPETDPATGNLIQPSNPHNIISSPAPYRSWDTFNETQGNDIENRTDTRVSSPNRSSSPVSSPIFSQPQSSMISSILGNSQRNSNRPNLNPQSFPDISAGQTTDKTQRRFLGNGLLSKGTYGNGSGDYGMEGTFGTNQMSEEDNLLNTLLGIPTAKAAEMQTNLFNQPNTDSLGRPYTGYSAQNGGMSTRYGVDTPPTFTPKNTLNEDYESGATGGYKPQATGGSGSGGVAQQYSQQGENPQEKYYKEAIKNAKKVMKETIKALEKEYKESEATGTAALNKQKREDLQAQSARFSFGLNQDPNSEQAIQYAQRTSNDYAGQLSDFLKKLASSKAQDISAAKQSYYDKQSTAQEKLAELMYNLQIEQEKNSKKGSGTLKNGSYTIIPGPNGENKYVYNNGSQYVPITADQYMAGKYGVGIGSYGGSQDNIEEMDEEELRSIAGY